MNTGQRGAWGETVAAAWLMKNGFEVFVGLGNTSCDLIAIRDGVAQRVEVKSACRSKRAPGLKPSRLQVTNVHPHKFDMLLVVTPEGDVLVNPKFDQVWGCPK